MHSQRHPEPDQLDRLRAGLLDGQPEIKAALEAHVATCATCQERCNWQLLQPDAIVPDFDTAALQQSLRNARRQALQADSQRRRHDFIPYATAALLLVAVSIGIWTLLPDNGGQQQMVAQDSRMIPDIYEDLEFYLWLANQKDNGNGDEEGNPNNT
jgi:hypothetical protein